MMNKKSKQEYLKPVSWALSLDEDNYLLAASPAVQPGGGGVSGHQGEIHVIDSQEEDGGDDDNLEG